MIDTTPIISGMIAEGVEPEVAKQAVERYVGRNTIKMKRLARKLRKQIKRDHQEKIHDGISKMLSVLQPLITNEGEVNLNTIESIRTLPQPQYIGGGWLLPSWLSGHRERFENPLVQQYLVECGFLKSNS